MSSKWTLTGTENQQRVVREAFARIKFPFDRLSIPGAHPPELGWRDLNSGAYGSVSAVDVSASNTKSFDVNETADSEHKDQPRAHGDNHHDGDKPDAVEGEIEGRRWIMGVIYPRSGRIFLDVRLERYPEMAAATLGAEIAHAVDFFLPMTDPMRDELLRLWNVPNTTWWERFDYGSEYFRLGGEAFMHEFVAAYTDINFGSKSSFAHDIGVEPEDVRRILGIERTDYVPPAPPAPPPPPPPPPGPIVVRFGKSKVFHLEEHYPKKVGVRVTDRAGMRPCKVCKPGS